MPYSIEPRDKVADKVAIKLLIKLQSHQKNLQRSCLQQFCTQMKLTMKY